MSINRDFIGPYQLIRMIRAGNTTTVWEAMPTGEQRQRIALKVLLERFKKNRKKHDELKHEANVGKDLSHQYVIKIFDYSSRYDLPFISMQLFNARNLKQELRERRDVLLVNLEEIIRKCAEGLKHLHESGWVHCDVKPDNFLVDEHSNVKLIDFSIARRARKSSLFGRPKRLQGTRSYMSPEQIRRKAVTPATDIYGLGCVIYEMLAGKPPFTGTTPDEVLNRHLRASLPSIQAANNAVSDRFTELLNMMLAKLPEKRPKSMAAFLRAYEDLNNRIFKAGKRPKMPSV